MNDRWDVQGEDNWVNRILRPGNAPSRGSSSKGVDDWSLRLNKMGKYKEQATGDVEGNDFSGAEWDGKSERLARQSKKYPQVGGGDTGDGKTYWVEHKDVDGSHVSWVKFDNKTDKLSVPSKPKSKPTPTPWIQTPQGKHHQKQIDQLTKKIEKSKEQEQAWYKNKFPMLSAKQKQEENLIRMRDNVIKSRSKPPKKKKKDDGMGGIKIW